MFHLKAGRILEALQADAIQFAEALRSQRNPNAAYDFEKGNEDIGTFIEKVKGHERTLGRIKIVRMLRHRTPVTRPIDKIDTGPDLEPHICWVEAVQRNIEYELEVIDRKRSLILTVASVVAATAAAIASFIALFKI